MTPDPTQELAPDPATILDPLPVHQSVKADAWDAFHSAAGPSHFKALMDPLALPDEAKADLWDLKFGQPAQTTEQPPTDTQPPVATTPPAPPKPSAVQRVSPATPNPPTAALPTAPEKPETIALQVQQLGDGARKVVMFPKGTTQPREWPQGVALTHDPFGNTYAYRPDLIRKGEIHTAAKNNTLPQILGSTEQGMGAPDKSALQGEPIVVAARKPEGTEAQSTATDEANLPATVAATQAVTPEGGRVSVESPDTVIRQRGADRETILRQSIGGMSNQARKMLNRTLNASYYRRMEPDAKIAELKKLQSRLTRGTLPGGVTRPVQAPILPPSQRSRYALQPATEDLGTPTQLQ